MDQDPTDQELLRALRSSPDCTLDELATAVGFPTTNFGRPFGHRVREPVEHLLAAGLVEEHGGRYRLSQRGRRTLAEWALNG